MNRIFKLSLVLILASSASQAQVLMKEMLTQEQKGMTASSVNWPGKKVYWTLKFDSSRNYTFETYTTTRYYYSLMLADNAAMSNAVKIPGMVRDLVITTYFEFYFDNGNEMKTFTL